MKISRISFMTISLMTFSLGGGFAISQCSLAQTPPDPREETRQDPPPEERRGGDIRHEPQNAREDQEITLPEGTVVPVRLADDVNSNRDEVGTLFTGTVDPSVLVRDVVVIPRGTEAHIRLVEGKKGGHIHGQAKVRLELTSLIMNGERLGVDSNAPEKKKGAAKAKSSAIAKKGEHAGGGAATAAGAGYDPTAAAGPVIAAFTAAKVEVKAGSRIEFRLESPFTFEKPPVNAGDSSH